MGNIEHTEPRRVTLYPRQWAVVEMHALNFDGNVSMALRRIVDDWAQDRHDAEQEEDKHDAKQEWGYNPTIQAELDRLMPRKGFVTREEYEAMQATEREQETK